MAGYSKMAWPQIEQLKKNNFGWNDEAEEAFQKLKSAMVTVHVLALPDFSAPFVVETDESGHGLGAVLMQRQRPLAYCKHVLSARARHKSIYEWGTHGNSLRVTKMSSLFGWSQVFCTHISEEFEIPTGAKVSGD